MTMSSAATAIVAAARGWVGTRFAHQGRLKKTSGHKGGVDCLGLLAGVAEELDLKDREGNALGRFDRTDYGHNPENYTLMNALDRLLIPVALPDMRAGDVAVMTLETHPQHVGILSDYPGGGLALIHAYAPARSVVEHRLDESWRAKITAAYRLFPKP